VKRFAKLPEQFSFAMEYTSLVNGVAGFTGSLVVGILARLLPLLRRLAAGEWDVGRVP
jgi:hypothetical protein